MRVTQAWLAHTKLRCIATASSGTDHIDTAALTHHGITLFDAKGSNARAVADYVVATVAYLTQKNKLHGLKAGVIGVGQVGSQVVARLETLGFEVMCHDPFKTQKNPLYHFQPLHELAACDLICVHANLHDKAPFPSKNLLNAPFLNQLRPETVLLNAARGGIVDEVALLSLQHPVTYCTDVYDNEPNLKPELIAQATLCTPHIAGHSIEAKATAIRMVAEKIYAHYGIPSPSSRGIHKPPSLAFLCQKTWASHVLSLYNPFDETSQLKLARNKEEAFLALRAAHVYRHDFD